MVSDARTQSMTRERERQRCHNLVRITSTNSNESIGQSVRNHAVVHLESGVTCKSSLSLFLCPSSLPSTMEVLPAPVSGKHMSQRERMRILLRLLSHVTCFPCVVEDETPDVLERVQQKQRGWKQVLSIRASTGGGGGYICSFCLLEQFHATKHHHAKQEGSNVVSSFCFKYVFLSLIFFVDLSNTSFYFMCVN